MARQASILIRKGPVAKARPSAENPLYSFSASVLTGLCALVLVFGLMMASQAQASSRSLRLTNAHTKESATITYKRNGKFDADGLRKLNQFLRDWRRNEKTQMDPALFDLIWEVYNKTGAKQPITVFSGYRSPATNGMLRTKSSGVAKNSRHTMGQAMDFYLPGVPLDKIRRVGLQMQAGGVGYYPGSRFIHIDTGNVRHWPRMTRKQLAKVFPDGVTVHVPTDGKPFSGYNTAKAQVAKRKAEMARSTKSVQRFTQYASAAPEKPNPKLTRTQVASLARKDEEQRSGGLLQTLLRQTPKEPPKPQFTEAEAASNADATGNSDPEAEADELLEEGPSAQALLLPQTLATLPRVRMVESTRISLAQNDQTDTPPADVKITPAENVEVSSTEAPVIQEATAPASETILFAAMPRDRPEKLAAVRYQLASAAPAPEGPLPFGPETQAPVPTMSSPQVEEAAMLVSAREETPAQEPVATGELVQMAYLPRAKALQAVTAQANAAPIPEATAVAPDPKQQTAKQMLAKLDGTKGDEAPNRFAYAAAGNTFLAALPTDNPRASTEATGTINQGTQRLASLETPPAPTVLPEPRAQSQAAMATESEADQLARLTFAYGPAGMSHFAHLKQRASTATFARLSRPAPNNLRGLVYKPHSMINQGFAPQLAHNVDFTHFEGPAIARLAVKRFN